MSINPETEITGTSYDAKTRVHSYTIARNGRQWTVVIPDDEFARFGPVIGANGKTNQARRRAYLGAKIAAAMLGEPDA